MGDVETYRRSRADFFARSARDHGRTCVRPYRRTCGVGERGATEAHLPRGTKRGWYSNRRADRRRAFGSSDDAEVARLGHVHNTSVISNTFAKNCFGNT
eukprot:4101584-Prymnesium_polylepis.1